MNLAPYRAVLGQPGMRPLLIIGLLARIPVTAAGMAITLHVVTALGLGYAEAGVAGALGMLGVGVGSPLAGRMIDRWSARPVLIVATVATAIYWAVAASLPYHWLIGCAFVAGLLGIPSFGVMRQYLAAMVPVDQRRTAFAIDSMAVELCYMAGPALAVAGVTLLGSPTTLYLVGAGLVLGGLALIRLNLPVRSVEELAEPAARVPRRQWLTVRLVSVLAVTMAITFIVSGTELSIVALIRDAGATVWTGLVIGLWCAYSLVGGFVFGALRRDVSPLLLVGGLGALTVPLVLFSGDWWWLIALLLPSGVLCAPAIASTVDTVSRWVPASARGEAMGLHGSALTVGIALGAPCAGAVIDTFGAGWGMAVSGGVGALLVLAAVPFWPRPAGMPATTPVTVEAASA